MKLRALIFQSEQDAVRKGAESEVLEYQRKMEDMQLNFSQMLKDTLDKVRAILQMLLGVTVQILPVVTVPRYE